MSVSTGSPAIYDGSSALKHPGETVKKTVSAIAVLLALTACGGPEQLSTEETCTEANAIVTAAGGDDEQTDELIQEVSEQLETLAERASDPLKDELKLLAETAAEGREAMESAGEDVMTASETVSEVCGF